MVLAVVGLLASLSRQTDSMSVAAVRFFSPATGTTIVEGTAEVSLAPPPGGGQSLRLNVEVTVLDSANLELQKNSWPREVPAAAAAAGAKLVESFSFRAAAGSYRVIVRVTPEGGRVLERILPVRAYAASPGMSDLLVASQVRQPAGDSAALAPGEVLRAGLVMRTAPVPLVSPVEPTLSYYAEIYPRAGGAARGELRAEVIGAQGRTIVTTPARPLELSASGGLSRGSLDLAGLPEGQYRLRLRLTLGDSTMAVEAPFAMAPLAASVAASASRAPATARAEDLMFDEASAERLDSLRAPLVHILEPEEERVFRSLTTEGTRRFLKSFWQRRDPTPQTPDNPIMQEYYRAVSQANELYREVGSGGVEGWRTDRGRIFLRNGRPDDALRRPAASPRPYEVWKFTRGRVRYYVFYDQSGLGNYRLIGTNDNREASQMDWERYLGPEGSLDVRQYIR